ncbi:MAG: xylulokinase [Pseudomonadota bacterium]
MYLGLDLGTSGVKALLIAEDQSVVASAQGDLSVSRPADGWSEQDPAHWIRATTRALRDLASQTSLSSVKAIGLSGQMHGATLLDASDQVLRPCILWNDTRSHEDAAALDADPRFREITGNIVFPGFTAPKLDWVRAKEPEIFAQVSKILLPKDYLRLWLTGEYVSEMSDAAGTSWLDTGARAWSDDLLAATQLDRSHMPSLVEGNAVSGALRAELAAEFGLPKGIPVAGGAGDNAASAIGMGITEPGQAFLSLGTSGVLFVANERYLPDPKTALHTFCHAIPDRWHQMGVILAATDALAWYGRLVGADPADLTGELGDLKAPGKTTFLPYLGGERTPHNDARIRGSFLNLDHATDRSAATRAVLEGVSFAFRDSLEAMRNTGAELSDVVAVGGGSQSEYWLTLLASVLHLPISVADDSAVGAALGAARLAMMAAGHDARDVARAPAITRTLTPDTNLSDAFDTAYRRYRAAYGATRELS